MYIPYRSFRLLPCLALFITCSLPAQQKDQDDQNDQLSGPDRHEHAPSDQRHLFGNWHGERQQLLERGVNLDLMYLSDSLWNLRSVQKERLANWNRVRGTVDLDFGKLTHTPGLSFQMSGMWQGGGNMGSYIGAIAGPSSMVSQNAFRLDFWWLQKTFDQGRIGFRLGQFAAKDTYGTSYFSVSYVDDALGHALANLSATYETFDPPATPAAEMRVIPLNHLYVKSMVYAADRIPFAHNPTGFVPQFRGAVSTASEIGWSPGRSATGVRPTDTIKQREGYAGLYQMGGVYNPGKFLSTGPVKTVSGNYVIYLMADQAVWRTSPDSGVGIDLTAATDWTPSDRSRVPRETMAGVRFDEPLPLRQHNTIAFGYVHSSRSDQFQAEQPATPPRTEDLLELNGLIEVTRSITLQPVVQRFLDVGGTSKAATVFGFRSKVNF